MVFSVILVFLSVSYVHAAPCAVVDQPDVYVGDIPQGKQLVQDFTLKNTGDETLIILKINPC
jgi:hypothetical protein